MRGRETRVITNIQGGVRPPPTCTYKNISLHRSTHVWVLSIGDISKVFFNSNDALNAYSALEMEIEYDYEK